MNPIRRLPNNKQKQSVKELKSISAVKDKAGSYTSSDETNKLVKKAILQELNSHLISIKPQVVHRKEPEGHRKQRKASKSALKYTKNAASGERQQVQRVSTCRPQRNGSTMVMKLKLSAGPNPFVVAHALLQK
eukprot:gene5686-6387_t